jgi:hypothetical protein
LPHRFPPCDGVAIVAVQRVRPLSSPIVVTRYPDRPVSGAFGDKRALGAGIGT